MKRLLALAFALVIPFAVAQNIKPTPPAQVVVTQQGTTLRAVLPRQTPFSVSEGVDGRVTIGATVFPNHNNLTVAFQGQVPKAPPKPPIATRTVQCPNGYTGTWTQTQDWAPHPPPNPPWWDALPWTPASAPPGACTPVAIGGDLDLSYVNKTAPGYISRFKPWVDGCLNRTDCYVFTATDIAFMARLDGGAQYCPKAVTMADAYAAKVDASIAAGGQPNWGGDANGSDGISSDSYLNIGGHMRDFALPMKWCATSMTPAQAAHWTGIMVQSLYNLWNPTLAKWGGRPYPWSGWALTDPGDNYFYSFTAATMWYEWVTGDAQYDARTWPVAAAYFNTIPTGGSEEGMGYGTSHKSLFESYRFEKNLTGNDYTDAHLTNSIPYWVWGTTPDFLRFGAIGDNSRVSNPSLWDYQWVLVSMAREQTPNAAMRSLAAWWLKKADPSCAMTNSINYRDGLTLDCADGTAPTALTYWGQSTGDFFWRTSWTDPHALWGLIRAGKYDQSHAHQDQGNVELYANGTWLTTDESVNSHSGIQQGPQNSTTLRFEHNGAVARQVYGSTSTMTVAGTDPATGIHTTANLQPAMGNAATAWTRTVDINNRTLVINDVFTPAAGYTVFSQIQCPTAAPVITGMVGLGWASGLLGLVGLLFTGVGLWAPHALHFITG